MHLPCLLVITAAATLVDVIYCSIPVWETQDWGGARSPMTAPSLPMHLAFETLNLRTWNGKHSSITKANMSTRMTASNLRSHPSELSIGAQARQVSWRPERDWPKPNLRRRTLCSKLSSTFCMFIFCYSFTFRSATPLWSVASAKAASSQYLGISWSDNQVPDTNLLGFDNICKWKKSLETLMRSLVTIIFRSSLHSKRTLLAVPKWRWIINRSSVARMWSQCISISKDLHGF